MLRPASVQDLPRIRDIESAAGEQFRDIGMDAIADDEPPDVEILQRHVRAGCAWVATDATNDLVAYLIADVVDDMGHIEQVSVHPGHAGRRIGRDLIGAAEMWASRLGLAALTLTTFADVPWNAPYYARLGFRVLAPEQIGEGLRRIREREVALGLDRWRRVAMYRAVDVRRVWGR